MSLLTSVYAKFLKFLIPALSKRRLPKINGTIILPGLDGSIEIIRDTQGIPHITASTDHDVFFAQGFVHAQDRLWQMELNRRVANGTLSELFGEIALETDKASRIFGFRRIAKQDLENGSDELKSIMQAYVDGINAHINSLETKSAVEFKLIKTQPELWSIEDVAAFGRLMIFQLDFGWYGEILRSKLIEAVGEENASKLEVHYSDDNPSVLPNGIQFNKINKKGDLVSDTGPFLNQKGGSNAWVISPKRSETGKAILCNDMHLRASLPSIWYENHLKSKNLNVSGVSAPGLPMVMVGHNEKISWGMTLSYIDTQDIFVEQFNKEGQYKVKTKWVDPEKIAEQIKIKDSSVDYYEDVIITHHGPIISSILNEDNNRLALCSMALQSNKSFEGWMKLNYGKNWNDFVTAMQSIDAPTLSVVYADVDGNIGQYCSGKVPIRKNHNGLIPVEGTSGKYDWKSYIPFEEMPHQLNPKEGFIVTCNNKLVADDFPHYLGTTWMNGFRARRITEYFAEKDKISIEDCKKMQLDFHCIPGLEFIELYKDFDLFEEDPNPKVKQAFEIMMNWDGNLTADTIGGCLYEVSRYFVVRKMLLPNLGEELTNEFMGTGFNEVLYPIHEFYGHDTVAMLRNLRDENSWWVKHAGGREQLLRHGFNQGFEWLMENVGLNVKDWTWGSIHKIIFPHSMSVQSPLDQVFNVGGIGIGGDTDTSCQMGMMPNDPFNPTAIHPSVRYIQNMGDLAKSYQVYAPGQSGQIGSAHYDDLVGSLVNGEYFVGKWTRGQIENNAEGTLKLNPLK